MYWLEVVWAVIRGLAGALSIEFERERAAAKDKQKKEGPAPDAPRPGPTAPAGPQSGSQPGPQGKGASPRVDVNVKSREGEFSSGLSFMGGAKVNPPQPEARRAEGESRRKKRTRPAPATPAEDLCARCKAVIEHELTNDAQDLAVPQEADQDEASGLQPTQPKGAAEQIEGTPEPAASTPASAEQPTDAPTREPDPMRRHIPVAERTLTRLGTRGSLVRLVESGASAPGPQ